MKTCGCPSDTLGSLLVTPLADRAWVNLGMGEQSGAGLAERSLHVNHPPAARSSLERSAFRSAHMSGLAHFLPPCWGGLRRGSRPACCKRSGGKGQSSGSERPPTPARPYHRAFGRTPVLRWAMRGRKPGSDSTKVQTALGRGAP